MGSVYLSVAETAAYLNVTERWVRRSLSERRLPFHKLGNLVRLRKEDLDRFLEAGRVEAAG